ncbi:MAG: diaminopimelate decarboxylase [Bulleidia sp.]
MICHNITNDNGNLKFAGYDVQKLARTYGTPLYLLDEERIRENCRIFTNAFKTYFHTPVTALYASKANCIKAIYPIMKEEGLGIDVVSCGEMHIAGHAGFPLQLAFFHSNNKTDADISYAMEHHIGYFVVDNQEELETIEQNAQQRNVIQDILIRITPGIDPHTYEEVNTGRVDSKFGNAIQTGQADRIVQQALSMKHVRLKGFHCHVGSQVFEEDVLERAAEVMLEYVSHVRETYDMESEILDIGGGFGVRYTQDDPKADTADKIRRIAETFYRTCTGLNLNPPHLYMEPGRSIVADAGMTLYTAGSIKHIPDMKTYVSVDGGMTDNPRFALYKSRYTVLPAGRMDEPFDMKCTVVGRCCESGDIIQPDVYLPSTIRKNDILAVCTTGAYNFSMSSRYNMLLRPAVVMLGKESERIVVRRETFDDLLACEI